MSIFINNKRDTDYGIYCGRGSVLGNRFLIGKDGTRAEVCAKYKVWLWNEFRAQGKVRNEVLRLIELYRAKGTLSLLCFCAPLQCHTEHIRSLILWVAKGGTTL